MSIEYAQSRVKDALEASGGNAAKAKRLLISWLENDQSLLLGLVSPHVESIVTHAVTRASSGPAEIPTKEFEDAELAEALAASLSGGSGAEFGSLSARTGKSGKASDKHVEAIHLLASKSGTTKED